MLNKGTYIADRYELVGKIGTGGMSDVYKAKDHTLEKYVAIKVLKQEFCEDRNFVTKFRAEAQAAAGLEHPNIVNVYDVGSQDGFHYIVMEYVEGITLKTYIEKKVRLSYKETLSIAIQVGRGIQAAHAKNIIHRDIKPQNIIISTEGKVKVTDFGIARAVSEQTIHSEAMGSVHYVSPEQARNGYVGNRSDIYSLGIVMYEMVTGKVPFDGENTVAVAIQHLQDDIVPPSVYAEDLPISLEKIILKCTQKSPDRRYDSMESLLVDLRKSLLSPHEDFVTIAPVNQDKTRVLTDDEVKQIQEKTSGVAPVSRDKFDDLLSDDDEEDDDDYDYDEDDDYDDDEEEEEEGRFLNSRMEKIVNVLRIIVAIIIALIVVYFVASFFGVFKFGFLDKFTNASTQTEASADEEVATTTTMINLLGMTVEEAEDALEDIGLYVAEKEEIPSAEYEIGQIAAQDVEKGAEVAVGTTIYVNVSSGPSEDMLEDVEVPGVVDVEKETAISMLEDAGLLYELEYEYSSYIMVGNVISQDPEEGSTVKEGDTVVITISRGTQAAEVPNLVGKTESEAKSALSDQELNMEVSTEYSDDVAEGVVISQDVEAGTSVKRGSVVKIVVSKGAKKVTYYTSFEIKAPSNVTVTYADIVLTMAESDQIIETWSGVTTFPYTAEVHGIEGGTAGHVAITWYYEDASGEVTSYLQEAEVTFHEE